MNRNFKITVLKSFVTLEHSVTIFWTLMKLLLSHLMLFLTLDLFWSVPFKTHHCVMCESLNWLQLKSRRDIHWFLFISKCPYFECPSYLRELLLQHSALYPFRDMQSLVFKVPGIFSATGQKSFHYKATSDWNNLPLLLRSILFQVNSIPISKHSMYWCWTELHCLQLSFV